MLRGKPFWFSSLGQQEQFGVLVKFFRTFGRTTLVTSGVLKKFNKTLTKSLAIVGSFQEKQRLKTMTQMTSQIINLYLWKVIGKFPYWKVSRDCTLQ